MSRRYLLVLAAVAVLILTVGLATRGLLREQDAIRSVTPPSEAATLQQLSQDGELRRMNDFLHDRVATAAAAIEWLPQTHASAVRWSVDTLISSSATAALVVLPRASADSARAAEATDDSASTGWVVAVGRRAGDAIISSVGLAGGRSAARCNGRDLQELVLGIPLHTEFAGAGLFALDGRLRGMVVRCGESVAALPIDEVRRLLAEETSAAHRVRVAFGFGVDTLDARMRDYFGVDSGVVVVEVAVGSPAGAVIRPGDVILAIGGAPTRTLADLRAVATAAPPESVTVTRRRGGTTTSVRLARRAATPSSRASDALGIRVVTPAPTRGVRIVAVADDSPAALAGLMAGDRLLRIDDAPVTSTSQVERLLGAPATTSRFVAFLRDSIERGVLIPR